MYTITARWPLSIRASHTVVCRADLYPAFGAPIIGVPVTGGSVVVDSTADVRRTLQSCTLADPTLVPSTVYSALAPYGSYIRPWRGIRYPDGTEELKPLGLFRISDCAVRDDGVPGITIDGSDRSRTVSRAKFTDPYVIAAGQNYTTAIGTLADNRLDGVAQQLAATAETTPLIVIDVGEDPWQHLEDMAGGFGAEVFYDQDGQFILQLQHDPTDDQVIAVYASGEDLATLTSSDGDATELPAAPVLIETDRSLTDDPGYNGVVMVAESTTLAAPIRTVLFDMDPNSPTYSQGPYGQVPAFQSSPYITSQTGCDAAAAAWLKNNIGGTEDITFTIVPDPALDADDVIRVIRAASDLDVIGVITGMTIPLTLSDPMPITLRSRQPLVTA